MRLNFFRRNVWARVIKCLLHLLAEPRIVIGGDDVVLVVDVTLRY